MNKAKLAVTGATGKVGGRVASRLAKLGVAQRLVVRDPGRAPKLPGAEIVRAFSYGDAAGMGKALMGVETLFLVSAHDRMAFNSRSATGPISSYDREKQQTTAIDAAIAVGVQRVVYLSFLNAAADSTFILARDHFHTEEHIRSLGVPFTFLRMSLYTDRLPEIVSADGVIRGTAGLGRGAFVTRDDLADVAVAVLTQSGHEGRTYDVTGPEALSYAEVADQLSLVSGREVSYQAVTPHDARTMRMISGLDKFEAERIALTGRGLSEYEVEIWISHFMQIATGELSIVSDTVPRLTGRKAQTLADYLHNYPESYKHLLPT